MGCGTSNDQRPSSPKVEILEEAPNENEKILDELFSKRIYYNKRTDEVVANECKPDKKEDIIIPFTSSGQSEQSSTREEQKTNYKLEHVYGYRAYDSKQNLHFVTRTKIVYSAASFGVVLDCANNSQEFISPESSDGRVRDVTCLAISFDRRYVAIGRVGIVTAWDIETCQLKSNRAKYVVANNNIISCCSWSYDSKYIGFVDKLNTYVINADTGEAILNKPSGIKRVLDICWSMREEDYSFATCGFNQMNFWQSDGTYTKVEGDDSFYCAIYDDEDTCYAGNFNGSIHIFEECKLSQKLNAHEGIVVCLNWCEGKIISGGSDASICIFNIGEDVPIRITVDSIPRSIDKLGDQILLGLKDGTICIINEITKHKTIVMNSHSEGEVWGLEVLETGNILTTGDDNKIILWSSKEHKQKASYTINDKPGNNAQYGIGPLTLLPDNQCSRAISYNPKTNEIAIGTNAGEIQVRDLNKLSVIKKLLQVDLRWIRVAVYSPDGDLLAIGTHSNCVMIYSTGSYAKKTEFNLHKSPIVSIDWTKNSKYIRSADSSFELQFFNIDAMIPDINGNLTTKDQEWATQTCKVGWNIKGIHNIEAANYISISHDKKLIAVGTDDKTINIYRYPCLEGAKCKKLYGHTENISRVKFGLKDDYLFSLGGFDKTLMQWKRV